MQIECLCTGKEICGPCSAQMQESYEFLDEDSDVLLEGDKDFDEGTLLSLMCEV